MLLTEVESAIEETRLNYETTEKQLKTSELTDLDAKVTTWLSEELREFEAKILPGLVKVCLAKQDAVLITSCLA